MDSAAYSFTPHLETLLNRRDLSETACTEIMNAIMDGLVLPASVAAWMIAFRAKGESPEELAALARVMRQRAVAVKAPAGTLDTCGTGGDASATFNISTAAALVAAGMGIPVAKHGGRSVSSKTGSADVLRALGVNIDAPAATERAIAQAGIGFMFAPNHHPGMKYVAPIRRELGVRTVFNLLGPLSNPAGAEFQLLGVYEPSLCEKFARVLQKLGSKSALVVCGTGSSGGYLDEVSTFGPTTIGRLQNGAVKMETFDAENELGLSKPNPDALAVKNADDSATVIRDILDGKKGPHRDITALNAAAAAIAAGKAASWPEALKLAEAALDNGSAKTALSKLVSITNS